MGGGGGWIIVRANGGVGTPNPLNSNSIILYVERVGGWVITLKIIIFLQDTFLYHVVEAAKETVRTPDRRVGGENTREGGEGGAKKERHFTSRVVEEKEEWKRFIPNRINGEQERYGISENHCASFIGEGVGRYSRVYGREEGRLLGWSVVVSPLLLDD